MNLRYVDSHVIHYFRLRRMHRNYANAIPDQGTMSEFTISVPLWLDIGACPLSCFQFKFYNLADPSCKHSDFTERLQTREDR